MTAPILAFFRLSRSIRNCAKAPEAIVRLQEEKLRRLVHHAYLNVPYYRQLFDHAGIRPADIQTLADLPRIPVTSKRDLQEVPEKHRIAGNVDLRRCRSFSTSGTTGRPMKTYFTRRDKALMNLSWIRAFLLSGLKPWEKMLYFVGTQKAEARKSWYEHLGIFRRMPVSTWEKPQEWIDRFRTLSPQILSGYVMTLKILAEEVVERRASDIRPRIIFHTSAVLDATARRLFGSVFKSRIVDLYGSDEAGLLAWECEICGAYHVCSDMVIVEYLDNGRAAGPGEAGEVVITNLHSYAMPFIRYRQGDLAVPSAKKPCCGRNFPLIEAIQGRIDDMIVLQNGRRLSPHTVYHCLDPVPDIKRWRAVQNEQGRLTVEIEPRNLRSFHGLALVMDNLRRLVGDDLSLDVHIVESIFIDPAVKFRAVVSNLGRPASGSP